ncbi:MAG: SIS domain-containing protein [Fretibacterium sp.]|nr:SIS domain-containing protein [Fretibacterium sp.]
MDNKAQYIQDYLALEKKTLEALSQKEIHDVVDAALDAYEHEGTIYICGNGGSAATASHAANDFNKGISEYVDKKWHFYCLNDNVATLMSIANDISYEEVFRFQLRNKLKPHDLVIGISGSGNSANVVNALRYAKEQGVKTVGWTGYSGGKVKELADVVFYVPLDNMQVVEDMHMVLVHLLMNVVQRLYKLPGHQC